MFDLIHVIWHLAGQTDQQLAFVPLKWRMLSREIGKRAEEQILILIWWVLFPLPLSEDMTQRSTTKHQWGLVCFIRKIYIVTLCLNLHRNLEVLISRGFLVRKAPRSKLLSAFSIPFLVVRTFPASYVGIRQGEREASQIVLLRTRPYYYNSCFQSLIGTIPTVSGNAYLTFLPNWSASWLISSPTASWLRNYLIDLIPK